MPHKIPIPILILILGRSRRSLVGEVVDEVVEVLDVGGGLFAVHVEEVHICGGGEWNVLGLGVDWGKMGGLPDMNRGGLGARTESPGSDDTSGNPES